MLDTQQLYTLAGKQRAYQSEKAKLLSQLEHNEKIVSFEDDGYRVLELLQKQSASQSVALYSELLSAIVRDVMGNEAPAITLQPSVIGNQPALDIMADKNGRIEDVVDAQGGGINNLLAAGFRFIALALSSRRRFVILDEPDCWLQVDLVPHFIKVLDALCEKMGVQAVFISHHQVVQDLPVYKVTLSNTEKGICAQAFDDRESKNLQNDSRFNTEYLNDIGIKQIRLVNYMSHTDTVIPLSAGLTTVVGPNNLGKSVLTRSLHDLVTNHRLDARIKDDASVASVCLTLEDNVELIWSLTRKSKGKPQATYALKATDGEVVELDEKVTTIPQWVNEYLQMSLPEDTDIDVHIGHQKDPLFILNPAISKFKRAEIVKLSDDYAQINKATKQHRSNMLDAKRQIKDLKQRLDDINHELSKLAPIHTLIAAAETLAEQSSESQSQDAVLGDLALLSQLGNERGRDRHTQLLLSDLQQMLSSCESQLEGGSHDMKLAQSLLERDSGTLDSSRTLKSLSDSLAGMERQLTQQATDAEIIRRYGLLAKGTQRNALNALQTMMARINEYAGSISEQYKLLTSVLAHKEAIAVHQHEIDRINQQLLDVESEIQATTRNNDGVCPLCEQPVRAH